MKKHIFVAVLAIAPAAGFASDYGDASYGAGGYTDGVAAISVTGSPYGKADAFKQSWLDIKVDRNGTGCLICENQKGRADIDVGEKGHVLGKQYANMADQDYMMGGGIDFMVGADVSTPERIIGFDTRVDADGRAFMAGEGDYVSGVQEMFISGIAEGDLRQHGNLCPSGKPCGPSGGFDLRTSAGGLMSIGQSLQAKSGGKNPFARVDNFSTGRIVTEMTPAKKK